METRSSSLANHCSLLARLMGALVLLSTTANSQPVITLGQTVNGTLEASDDRSRAGDGYYADYYRLVLTTQQTVTIDMKSAVIDTYLIAASTSQAIFAENDDFLSGTNSRLEMTLRPGTYYIEATSYFEGESGPYTLSVTGRAAPSPTPISLGQSVDGVLEASDARSVYGDGSFADQYQLFVGVTQTVEINVTSSDFDTNLQLIDDSNDVIAYDYDEGGTNSRLQLLLARGTYIIEVTTFVRGDSGPYILFVDGSVALPVINSLDHGATFDTVTGFASNTFGTIKGTNLVNATTDWSTSFVNDVAPTMLGGAQVLVNEKPAFISFTGRAVDLVGEEDQINFVFADEDARGMLSVRVVADNGSSTPVMIEFSDLAPAFFLWANRYITALQADYSSYAAPSDLFGAPLQLPVLPAASGDYIRLFGTGFGATTPLVEAGRLPAGTEETITPVRIYFGGVEADVVRAGLSTFAAVYEIVVRVPNLADGDHEVRAQINGVMTPVGAYITVNHQSVTESGLLRPMPTAAQGKLERIAKQAKPETGHPSDLGRE